jgi:uncharacterized membrane protein (UPF0127 family)
MSRSKLCNSLVSAGFSLALLVMSTVFSAADTRAMVLPVDPVPLIAETGAGELSFKVEIADDTAERSMGLMFRDHMPADQGMLFVFEETRDVGFWMKNTKLPLDLIFIGEDGKVKAIRHGEPMSEAVISPNAPVRFVLELNAGTAAARGIEPGAQIRHREIDAIDGQGNGNSPG